MAVTVAHLTVGAWLTCPPPAPHAPNMLQALRQAAAARAAAGSDAAAAAGRGGAGGEQGKRRGRQAAAAPPRAADRGQGPRLPAAKRRALSAADELAELAADYAALRALKRGKLDEAGFEAATGMTRLGRSADADGSGDAVCSGSDAEPSGGGGGATRPRTAAAAVVRSGGTFEQTQEALRRRKKRRQKKQQRAAAAAAAAAVAQ
jgi:hypothetical protein